ncbi:DEAD/DEAH box helicase family protein [Teredinibacter turnerae]|uniref:DEAD/DEAH box helicase family protein n=1 Tax=Teredinibacter turnerae TaxID=2426 RepID=UPI0003821B77|nr:DEAD/DEAH box helicase family protein [Teredinibacter turnerae]
MDRIIFMQSINFEHLRPHWPDLASLCGYAEHYVASDPQSALIKLRCFAELLVGEVYTAFRLPTYPNDKFMDRLQSTAFEASVGDKAILDKLHAIRKTGNRAAHEGKFGKGDSVWLLKEAHILSYWLLLITKKGSKADIKGFELPQTANDKQLAKKDAEHKARLEQALKELEQAKAREEQAARENAKLRQQLSDTEKHQNQAASQHALSHIELNEAETRRQLIDRDLYSAGWDIDLINNANTEEVWREVKVLGQPTNSGDGYCDYVLWDADGKPLAVVEAKRTRENPEIGRKQAVLYADALEKEHDQRPVIFLTNGKDIYILDDAQNYGLRKLYGFYSKESVQYLIRQRTKRGDLLSTTIRTDIAGRDYQIETITRVCERYAKLHRKALVVQATGTGKTRVSIALSKRMIDAGWTKRILFLCDRKELRKQAGKAYSEYLSEPVYIVGKSKKADMHHARIYIATYPGMMRIMEKFDSGYFDLIIADESHRSIYNVYGDLFKYYDALQLGLTATPVEMVSRSTTHLFGCDYKMPTANYPLEQAVADKNLVPFKVVSHTTQFLREGIQGKSLSDEQTAALEDQGIDPNTLDFDAKAIDDAVYNKDTNRHILRNLMERGLRMGDGQTLGKTIIFARNIKHAEILAKLFSEMYPEFGGNFCQVIHSKFERAEELIDDFKLTNDSKKKITIAISVDMLDTGIDVPEVLNLVFAKPVKSKVKFWQMIGRGTRLSKNLFGPGLHKSKFLIFDHWANFEYFELNHEDEDARPVKSLSQKLFKARVYWAETALRKAEMEQFYAAVELIKQDIDALDDNCIAIKDNWRIKSQYQDMEVLKQFAPFTKNALYDQVEPLMQWRNIQGKSEALRWDMEVISAQQALLDKSDDIHEIRAKIQYKMGRMAMHRNEVRQKAETIRLLQQDDFWQTADFEQLEKARKKLRDVIHLREKDKPLPPGPDQTYDIPEDISQVQIAETKTNIRNVDYEIYRQEVEKTLEPLFNKNPILQKIRAGESITDDELNRLNALVHTQNARVDLKLLKEFFPESSAGIDQLLRTIIGLDVAAVEKQFEQFIQAQHIRLNSLQQRFLSLLKNEICTTGQMTVSRLYEQPFTSLHQDGVDGLFQDEEAHLIATFVAGFMVDTAKQRSIVQTHLSEN